jgi:hypothetical protein
MQVNSAQQDTVYYLIALFILALSLILSLYLIVGTDAGQLGKIMTAIGMIVLELILVWQILTQPQLTVITTCIGIFVGYFLVTHVLLSLVLTFGNRKLKRIP